MTRSGLEFCAQGSCIEVWTTRNGDGAVFTNSDSYTAEDGRKFEARQAAIAVGQKSWEAANAEAEVLPDRHDPLRIKIARTLLSGAPVVIRPDQITPDSENPAPVTELPSDDPKTYFPDKDVAALAYNLGGQMLEHMAALHTEGGGGQAFTVGEAQL